MSYRVNGTLPKDSAEISRSFKVLKLVSLYVNTVARERDKALVRFIVLVMASLSASNAVVTRVGSDGAGTVNPLLCHMNESYVSCYS
jgi:hypothetical protein